MPLLSYKSVTFFCFLVLAMCSSSCSLYKQHFMFRIDESEDLSFLVSDVDEAESDYRIRPNDRLDVQVFTNGGERIIDPNFELEIANNQNNQNQRQPEFEVQEDGRVKLPMLGHVALSGMSRDEAEQYLQGKYAEYYKDPFVNLRYLNKRVIVLGATGGQVIPLENDDISLLEVLALAGGIDQGGKAHNIRLIRGDLHRPQVYQIDLSTLAGMRKAMTDIQPDDIVYVEPVREIVTESIRDLATVLGLITSTITLIVLLNRP
jgi:polysaccharide export outer membrane protein